MFEELKARQSVMWGNGPYQRITETISDVHDLVVSRLEPQAGEQVLDLACGTGAVAERMAERGAEVTGADLAPALIDTARDRAAELGLEIDYRVEDCERLGFGDASFDGVTSTFGIMFAPDHQAAAAELARITRPGGRIVLANWTPDGGVGKMFAVVSAFQPAPPPSKPVAWGEEESVRALLGEWFDLVFEEQVSTLEVGSGEEMWELFSTSFGPVKTLAETLEPDRREEFHRAWVGFFEDGYRTDDGIAHTRDYLLVHGTRR